MEHLNRQLKHMMGNLGSNVHPSAIQRVAKSLGVVDAICHQFEAEAEASINKGYSSYSYPSFVKDFNQILNTLEDQKVFEVQEGRTLRSYTNSPFFTTLKWKNITAWIKSKLINLKVY